MSSFNKVVLVGHLGSDPIIRDLENHIKVADLLLATNESYNRNGETREITDWHEIVAWRKLAEFSEKHLEKGKKILVEGKLRTNTWEDKETGKKRKATYILAETIRFMERKNERIDPAFARFQIEDEDEDPEEIMDLESLNEIPDEEENSIGPDKADKKRKKKKSGESLAPSTNFDLNKGSHQEELRLGKSHEEEPVPF